METIRNFKYRIYPSRKQISRLYTQFDLACKMYNILLTIKKDEYKITGKSLSKFDMNKKITELKQKNNQFKNIYAQVLQNITDRISKAYDNFFRRVKEKKSGKKIKLGFPRYKKYLKSIAYPQNGFKFISDKKLHISNIGNVPIVLHRVPKGKIKTMCIKRAKSGKWFVIFSCEIESNEVHPYADKSVGIDLGLIDTIVTDEGNKIPNPKYLIKSELKLKRLQRNLSRKQKGSKNREKARIKLAIVHEKVANQRADFLHKTSRSIVNDYGIVCVENLNINGMIKNHRLAKHIGDASWGTLLRMISYKASSAGGKIIVGDPFEPTSQICSGCGAYVKKSLADRIHNCPICGLKISRDHNAAINIKKTGLKKNRVGHTRIHACGDSATTPVSERGASGIDESGTIHGQCSF